MCMMVFLVTLKMPLNIFIQFNLYQNELSDKDEEIKQLESRLHELEHLLEEERNKKLNIDDILKEERNKMKDELLEFEELKKSYDDLEKKYEKDMKSKDRKYDMIKQIKKK